MTATTSSASPRSSTPHGTFGRYTEARPRLSLVDPGGMMGDDFCIDENAGVAYVATGHILTADSGITIV